MNDPHASPAVAASLLIELVRAIRARQLCSASDPILPQTLERTSRIWIDALRAEGGLALELQGGAFLLPSGVPVRGAGIDELANDLERWAVPEIRVHRDLEAGELAAVIETLAAEPDSSQGAFQAALESAGVRHVSTGVPPLRPQAVPSRPETNEDVLEEESTNEAGEETPTGANGDSAPEQMLQAEPARADGLGRDAVPEVPKAGPDGENATEALERMLEQMEGCREPATYAGLVEGVVRCAETLLGSQGATEVERAVATLWSHVSGETRLPEEIRELAEQALRKLGDHPQILGRIVVGACSGTATTSPHVELLRFLGPIAVPRLLEEMAHPGAEVRRRVTEVIVGLQEESFPILLNELLSEDPKHIQRAANLLGELKDPRAAEFLVEQLFHSDPSARKAVSKALVQVGCDRVRRSLAAALEGPPEIGELAAYCLGSSTEESVVMTLARVVDPESTRPESVRREAIRSLGRIGNRRGAKALVRVLAQRTFVGRRRHRVLRIMAAQALGKIGGEVALNALLAHARDRDPAIRQACLDSLRRLREASAL
jgi:HEAT repeat protein